MITETTITFNGTKYPAKEIVLFEGEREEQTVLVAEERLCNVLYNYGIYCLPEAELIAMLENL